MDKKNKVKIKEYYQEILKKTRTCLHPDCHFLAEPRGLVMLMLYKQKLAKR